MAYQHILIPTDLSAECHRVLRPATQMQSALGCKLSLVHVIEPLGLRFGADVPLDPGILHDQQARQATARLDEVLDDWPTLLPQDCHLRHGQPRAEIHQLARDLGCDLILVGSHGRHGLALLLGSTANAVLHGSPCDVLAVRI